MNAQLALALALGHEPRLLILDEPASGLDVVVRRDFLESIIGLIQEEGRTVFLSSHLVHEVERVADRVAIIEAGRLRMEGTVDELKQSAKRVVVHLAEDAGELTGISGLREVRGEGAQRLLTVVGYGAETSRPDRSAGRANCGRDGSELRGCFRRPTSTPWKEANRESATGVDLERRARGLSTKSPLVSVWGCSSG